MTLDADAFARVVTGVVASNAEAVDREARLPDDNLKALKDVGVLGLTVAPDHGGGGGTIADAAAVIEELAGVCGSTAMVVLMHYAAAAIVEAHGPDDVRRAI